MTTPATIPAGNKVIVLDRDGTIIIDHGYLSDPERVEFLPGAAEALQALVREGYRLVVVTNQSGVGRGMFSVERMHAVNDKFKAMCAAIGAPLAGVYSCPHGPEEGCNCRKPRRGLMDQAAAELQFDPAQCVVIGDKLSDVEFGRGVGATTFLIRDPSDGSPVAADHGVSGLGEAAALIIGNRRLS
jgi:D-glycero-D-manno-heptose 1,7-bisphosphate phosphatase